MVSIHFSGGCDPGSSPGGGFPTRKFPRSLFAEIAHVKWVYGKEKWNTKSKTPLALFLYDINLYVRFLLKARNH